jgi:hypothetical protein
METLLTDQEVLLFLLGDQLCALVLRLYLDLDSRRMLTPFSMLIQLIMRNEISASTEEFLRIDNCGNNISL